MKLENKVAIVTGAGSGMGKAIAGLFAKEGAKVIASDINETGVKDLIASSGDIAGEIVFSQTDVSNRNQVETMIDLAVNKYGKLDVLVNNAGVLDKMYSVTEVEDEFWDKVMSININSVMYACRKAIPIMMKNGGGSIINTASVGGLFGCRAGAAYTASKFAVVGLDHVQQRLLRVRTAAVGAAVRQGLVPRQAQQLDLKGGLYQGRWLV